MTPRTKWRELEEQTAAAPTCAATLGVALVCWARDPEADLTWTQRQWFHKRVHLLCAQRVEEWMTPKDVALREELHQQGRTLTEAEAARIIPLLLAWSAGKTYDASLREGLRGLYDIQP